MGEPLAAQGKGATPVLCAIIAHILIVCTVQSWVQSQAITRQRTDTNAPKQTHVHASLHFLQVVLHLSAGQDFELLIGANDANLQTQQPHRSSSSNTSREQQ